MFILSVSILYAEIFDVGSYISDSLTLLHMISNTSVCTCFVADTSALLAAAVRVRMAAAVCRVSPATCVNVPTASLDDTVTKVSQHNTVCGRRMPVADC